MKTKIIAYQNGSFITESGDKIAVSNICGQALRVGDYLEDNGDGTWTKTVGLTDENCVNGVCDLKTPDNK